MFMTVLLAMIKHEHQDFTVFIF